jgi:hypothetical protein
VLGPHHPPSETGPAAVEPTPSPATTQEPTRAYESVEARERAREVLREPTRAPWRGIYRGGDDVRLRLDGPVVNRFSEPGLELPYGVFETRDGRARMVVTSSSVALLVWVELAGFVPQPREPLVLAPLPGRLPGEGVGRIEIAPGERVRVLRTQGEWHEVAVERRGVSGWLPVAAFAPVFAQGSFPVRTTLLSGTTRRRVRVLDRPGGKPIWRIAAESEVDVVRETKGWFEIVYVEQCHDTFRVTGFVRKSDLRDVHATGGGGFGCGHIGVGAARSLHDDAIEVTLPEGTELFDEAGQLVGLARKNNVLRRKPDGTLQAFSRWGPITVIAEVEATALPPKE